jgi:excisionase family DNA binding protein
LVALTEKLTLSIAEVSELSGVCRSNIYLAVSAGKLRAIKRGRSTLIRQADLRDWIDSLPDYSPAPVPANTRPRGVPASAE